MPKRVIKEVNSWFERDRIVKNLERFQDFIIVSLCLGLFCVMLLRLGDMFFSFLHPLDLREITSDILFILILVELFRLLLDYLQTQQISVGAAVEITMVSALREVILRGVLELQQSQLFGISAFLLVLAVIFVALPLMSGLFEHVTASKQETLSESTEMLSHKVVASD
ncbi:phosphate-starvation-inducible PsiE family protein [Nostoc sp. FACHB-152]|uniref:phosphate-starvation-inducible PsiE family protein n=1 Tax=unclassified Nostoc TaxID=2593658 RepID=UPI001682E84A|nr:MULTISPECIES: phosphate-starvation-inducible PsiE family protein [unclassified Nostoc]MBD2449779.1 phosphate-starvation-inducible PsiE family protein [Nostoc sp. FACHB-152]MBD2471133.1 phosphate-starvation-inducible PsiE family protein [Nostoc sp. FACHB-145]